MTRNEAGDVLDLPPGSSGDTLTVAQGIATVSLKNIAGALPPATSGAPPPGSCQAARRAATWWRR